MQYNKSIIKNTKPGVRNLFLLLVIGIFLNISCTDIQTDAPLDKNKQELAPEEAELRGNLESTANLLKKIIIKPNALNELRYAIDFYTKQRSTDERVVFSDLLKEEAAYKISRKKEKADMNSSNSFAEAFREAVSQKKKGDSSSSSFDMEAFLIEEGVEVYFPYSENWEEEDVIPTLTYDPIDNEDINEGWQPIVGKVKANDSGLASVDGWKEVTVDDDYAYNNPTMIILPPEDGGGGGGGSGGGSGSGSSCTSGNDCADKVQIGSARLSEHFDGLFAGGSEIRWVSADLVNLTSNGTPELRESRIAYNFSRKDIRKKYWKTLYSQYDTDWEEKELSKELLIYEADGNGTISLELGLQVDLGSVKPNFNFEYELSKKRETLLKTYYKRSVFMAENKNDLGNGIKDGAAVRYANHLKWTMPVRKIPLN